MTISMDKQYRTRDRREVRIYAMDGANEQVHGAVLCREGWVQYDWYRESGYFLEDEKHRLDLIEVKEEEQ